MLASSPAATGWRRGQGQANQTVDELTPQGQAALRLSFAAPYYTYRAVPILPGQLRRTALLAGMSKLNPRTPSGTGPPALSQLHVSYGRRGLRVRFKPARRASVRFPVELAVSGHAVGWRCLPVAGRLQPQHRCTRFIRVGASFSRAGRSGPNSLIIDGPIAPHRLAPGTYRLVATPLAPRHTGDFARTSFRVGG